MKFLLCKPKFYRVAYSINPWMDVTNDSDYDEAIDQWEKLLEFIALAGGYCHLVNPQPTVPDMVFTANAGLILPNNRVILSRFKHNERSGEEAWFRKFFEDQGFEVYQPQLPFEGAGDALFLNGTLIGGYGFRTDKEVYDEFRAMGWVDNVIPVRLIDPYFYHLDTCFCPLEDGNYLIHPEAFDAEGMAAIRACGGRSIRVPRLEARQFACNAVQVERKIFLPENCPNTVQKLEEFGYQPYPLAMSEFLKAGGACKCLTLRLM